ADDLLDRGLVQQKPQEVARAAAEVEDATGAGLAQRREHRFEALAVQIGGHAGTAAARGLRRSATFSTASKCRSGASGANPAGDGAIAKPPPSTRRRGASAGGAGRSGVSRQFNASKRRLMAVGILLSDRAAWRPAQDTYLRARRQPASR